MAKQLTIRVEVTLELDEERLRDIFEEEDIKFTKKKMKEIAADFEESFDQSEFDDLFDESVRSFVVDNYGE